MVLAMIGKCSECGKRRKLYHAIGSTINALWCSECIAKHKDNIWRVYEIDEEAICHLRKVAYGLSACRNCPLSCPISQDNLNRLSNIETILEKAKPPFLFYGEQT
jgi:hypothetical protein